MSRRIKARRTNHRLSEGKRKVSVRLAPAHPLDILQQYPLQREVSLDCAQQLGVLHPCCPGTHASTPRTLAFLAFKAKVELRYPGLVEHCAAILTPISGKRADEVPG
ncbi:hypothetical protein ACPOLB_21855 [Rubrivivax sp. RP6-9]|uniref:hypothetical protein n=1 Tax=Rubrivivax sp. RP6-9 TaxID=3415750 RepID=UPI003CC581A3